MSTWSHTLLNLLICVGLLAVMPLGLRLVPAPGMAAVHRLWPIAAAPAAASLWLPRGWLAALLAAAYLPATTALLASAALLVSRDPRAARTPMTVAVATALAAPTVAGCALVAERAGHELFGFDLDVLALTVAHFHYAGFAAALVAGLVCAADGDGPAGRFAALSVPAGVAVVFAGFFTSEWVELAGAAVLTAGMWTVGWLTWRQAQAGSPASPPARDGSPGPRESRPSAAARWLLLVSAVTLAATMVLALSWALGQAAGLPHLSLSWMVATHGLANALGFALCALVAWQRAAGTPGRGTDRLRRLGTATGSWHRAAGPPGRRTDRLRRLVTAAGNQRGERRKGGAGSTAGASAESGAADERRMAAGGTATDADRRRARAVSR